MTTSADEPDSIGAYPGPAVAASAPPAAGARRRRGPEPWVWVAYALALLAVAWLLYLGLRFDGTGPIRAFSYGPIFLTVAACLTLLVGLVRTFLFRPVLRRQRLPGLLCLAAVIGFINYPIPFPAAREGRPSTVRFTLPVEGEWTVVWGGEEPRDNLLARVRADRRWGLDLVVTGEDGKSHVDSGARLVDYLAWDRPVLAPADGVVVRAVDGLPDQSPGAWQRGVEEFGNHVVIRVAEGEYVFLAHLREGSLLVGEGDAVRAGQELARVGNSGFSTFTPEPHLALHLQDSPEPHLGQAVPWRFHDYEVGGTPVEVGLPRGGRGSGGSFTGERVRARER